MHDFSWGSLSEIWNMNVAFGLGVPLISSQKQSTVPLWKQQRWQWKNTMLNRRYICKCLFFFHCHLSFLLKVRCSTSSIPAPDGSWLLLFRSAALQLSSLVSHLTCRGLVGHLTELPGPRAPWFNGAHGCISKDPFPLKGHFLLKSWFMGERVNCPKWWLRNTKCFFLSWPVYSQ